MYTYTYSTFFTVFNIFLVLISPLVYEYVDVLLTSAIVLVISTYLLYVDPGYFRVRVQKHESNEYVYVDSTRANVLHVVFHVLPFLYTVTYFPYYAKTGVSTGTLISLLLFTAYATYGQLEEVYDVPAGRIAAIGTGTLVLYILLVYFK
jgi:hypothetical protein